jgi:hypothetical protein
MGCYLLEGVSIYTFDGVHFDRTKKHSMQYCLQCDAFIGETPILAIGSQELLNGIICGGHPDLILYA